MGFLLIYILTDNKISSTDYQMTFYKSQFNANMFGNNSILIKSHGYMSFEKQFNSRSIYQINVLIQSTDLNQTKIHINHKLIVNPKNQTIILYNPYQNNNSYIFIFIKNRFSKDLTIDSIDLKLLEYTYPIYDFIKFIFAPLLIIAQLHIITVFLISPQHSWEYVKYVLSLTYASLIFLLIGDGLYYFYFQYNTSIWLLIFGKLCISISFTLFTAGTIQKIQNHYYFLQKTASAMFLRASLYLFLCFLFFIFAMVQAQYFEKVLFFQQTFKQFAIILLSMFLFQICFDFGYDAKPYQQQPLFNHLISSYINQDDEFAQDDDFWQHTIYDVGGNLGIVENIELCFKKNVQLLVKSLVAISMLMFTLGFFIVLYITNDYNQMLDYVIIPVSSCAIVFSVYVLFCLMFGKIPFYYFSNIERIPIEFFHIVKNIWFALTVVFIVGLSIICITSIENNVLILFFTTCLVLSFNNFIKMSYLHKILYL